MENKAAHLLIEGRVQGVCFRMYTKAEARRLGLSGWVRNLPDSNVEAYAEGEKDKVEQFIAWCHHGPPHARVTQVKVQWTKPEGLATGFQITY